MLTHQSIELQSHYQNKIKTDTILKGSILTLQVWFYQNKIEGEEKRNCKTFNPQIKSSHAGITTSSSGSGLFFVFLRVLMIGEMANWYHKKYPALIIIKFHHCPIKWLFFKKKTELVLNKISIQTITRKLW